MFYLLNFLKMQAWKAALGDWQLQRGKGRARIHSIGQFCKTNKQKKTGSWNIKILLLIKGKQTSQINEFTTFLWEDARVWDHWNHFFNIYLNYLGPVLCSFPSWIPSGCMVRVKTVSDGLKPQYSLFTNIVGDILHPYVGVGKYICI